MVAPAAPSRTILLVDDDDLVRAVFRRILEVDRFQVLEARHGQEALAVAERHEGPIDLLISDLSLPTLSGPEIAQRIRETRAETRVLLVSGFLETEFGTAKEKYPILLKPFSAETLREQVRSILGQG